ncbi:hypothetical protein DVS77_14375 [Mycolicibacterium moriokaense]|nr:hypothetical protein DVS77_14375 [Mycolicibacterium moriokaense]
MPSILSVFTRAGRLPPPLRTQLDQEGIVAVAERVRVRQRFSGSVPGMFSSWGANRHIGLLVFTRKRLRALVPSMPRLDGPAIDVCWDDSQDGPARVAISESGVRLTLDVNKVDPRFRGDLMLDFTTALSSDVLAALPTRSLAFDVTPAWVFRVLGVRVR